MNFLTKLVFVTTSTSVFLQVGLLGINLAQAGKIKDMYVFGDSLVDGGRFYQFTNSTFPPSQLGYYQGRFTNHLVFPELMPQQLGFNYNSANNFAIGGSGTDDYHPTGVPGLGLTNQLNTYLNSVNKADKKALYLISSGSNDYNLLNPADGILNDIEPVINNLTQAVTKLANAGAKNFMVVGVPDFGKIPANTKANWGSPADKEAALNLLTNVSNIHNQLLAESLQQLNDTLNIKTTFFDLNTILYEALKPDSKFDFTNVTDGCLEISIEALAAGQFPTQPPCSNSDEYLFYDWSHPTAAAHKIIARYAVRELTQKKDKIKKKNIEDRVTQQDVSNQAILGPNGNSLNDIKQVPEPTNFLGLVALGTLGAGTFLKRSLK